MGIRCADNSTPSEQNIPKLTALNLHLVDTANGINVAAVMKLSAAHGFTTLQAPGYLGSGSEPATFGFTGALGSGSVPATGLGFSGALGSGSVPVTSGFISSDII